jgi:hypothetical protein
VGGWDFGFVVPLLIVDGVVALLATIGFNVWIRLRARRMTKQRSPLINEDVFRMLGGFPPEG